MEFEEYRGELTGYCYRMLGSAFEAEDAVQETLVRAWQGAGGFEGRSSVRSWLYRIATNVCLNMLKSGQRRARPMDLVGPGGPIGAELPEATWVGPMPDHRLNPADLVVARETVGLAFVAALQCLTPGQRAVLIMREVLVMPASEVAEALDTTVASVKSTLQRARAAMAERAARTQPARDQDAELLKRFVDAFERHDLEALISLLHEDVTMSMPPYSWWMRGRDTVAQAIASSDSCRGARLVWTASNGTVAFGQYRPVGDGRYEAFALQVMELADGRIAGVTTFLDAGRLFPLFDLPLRDSFPGSGLS